MSNISYPGHDPNNPVHAGSPGEFGGWQQPSVPIPPARRGRGPAGLLSVLGGILGLPVALGLLYFGGGRLHQKMVQDFSGTDALGILALVAGALLLLGVAALGAASPAGPITGGLLWGVLPGVFAIVAPFTALDVFGDVLSFLGREVYTVGTTWLLLGAQLGVGLLLTGTGVGAALLHRRVRAAR